MDEELILARMEFERAYRTYTEASHRMSLARTKEERTVAEENFQKASNNFNDAYLKLKELDSPIFP